MCGICGFYGFEDKSLIKRMTDVITHRGPDQSGIYSDKKISLGHRRLSIIDLSKRGIQPMTNEDGNLVIVYNGEIYNFKEIKTELEKKGHNFKSNTDTEVVVHAYEEYGIKCIEKFNGMFAFAIWNSDKEELILARDRIGIKPLYYYHEGSRFIFASEIKSILECDVPRIMNQAKIADYLSLRYVPGDETLFSDIFLVPQGHYLVISKKGIEKRQYWSPFGKNSKDSTNTASSKLKDLLKDSVKKRLIADVPLGLYLSGGIDSASILAMMSSQGSDIKTFTVGFGEDIRADELKRARITAEHFGTTHHELIIEPAHFKKIPELIWHLDQPMGDLIITANYYLAQLARKKVKVVLSGEGADETMAGYVQYRNLENLMRIKRFTTKSMRSSLIPGIMRKVPVSVLDRFFDYPESMGHAGRERLAGIFSNLDDHRRAYLDQIALFSDKELKSLNKSTPVAVGFENNLSMFNGIQRYEYKNWLPENILFRLDKMTMANSLEGRVPFLDHRIVQYLMSLPRNHKINRGTEKFILRKSMKDLLPANVVKRRKKGFFIPTKSEYHREIYSMFDSVLDESRLRVFKSGPVQKIISNRKKSRFLSEKQMTAIMNLEIWHRIFIGQEKPEHIL